MSKKQQQKVGLCKKSSSTDAKAKEEKKRHLRRKTKINKQTKKPDNSGILLSVTQSFSGFPGGSRDHPSFMICSRARSLCTFTALVEIRCCGPSSCDTQRERERKRKRQERIRRVDSVGLWQTCSGLLAPGYHTDWQAQPTAWETDGEEEKKRGACQSQPEISGLEVGWEICVLTIWNRHLHCDSTNPAKA